MVDYVPCFFVSRYTCTQLFQNRLSERMANGECLTEVARLKGTVVTLFDKKNFIRCVHLAWDHSFFFNERRSSFPRVNAIASHKKFRNIALYVSFRTAQEKRSLCNWMQMNMDKPDNPHIEGPHSMEQASLTSFESWLFTINIKKPTVLFGRTISVRQLPAIAVLSDNLFWNRCIHHFEM